MKISMLIENNRLNGQLAKEHGLSLYIETVNRKIVFDTGVSGNFVDNASKMGIDLQDVDTLVISHAHKDHSGGLLRFLEINSKATVFMSSKVDNEYYAKMLCVAKNISMPTEIITNYKERIIFIDDFTTLGDEIFILTKFVRHYPLVKGNKNLFVKQENKLIVDDFSHELALVIRNHDKLVMISGCSHNGIENMIETLRDVFPQTKIQAVIGGFHLLDFPKSIWVESKDGIKKIGKRLLGYEIEKIYTCHCTGKRAFYLLKEVMGNTLEYFNTGMEVELSAEISE